MLHWTILRNYNFLIHTLYTSVPRKVNIHTKFLNIIRNSWFYFKHNIFQLIANQFEIGFLQDFNPTKYVLYVCFSPEDEDEVNIDDLMDDLTNDLIRHYDSHIFKTKSKYFDIDLCALRFNQILHQIFYFCNKKSTALSYKNFIQTKYQFCGQR